MDLPIRRALLSVSDKSGLLEIARQLVARGVQLLSTGGTAKALIDAGIAVREVADFTGFPEIMDGRVKTLHPKIHGGLLGRRGTDDAVMSREGILPIDLLVVNLYPFAATVAKPGVAYAEAIENIDVGGPAMLRGAAKNHADVTVVVDPADYPGLLAELNANEGATRFEYRARLAAKAFAHTATYDALVADYLMRQHPVPADPFPVNLGLGVARIAALRYGENPHQRAAFYRNPDAPADSIAGARFAQGKELSFNNIADADTALECVRQFDRPACVIVKHANPCGVAVAEDLAIAYERAYRTDPTSAFGGIIAFNRPLDADTAQQHPGAAVRRGDRRAGTAARHGRGIGRQAQCARAGHQRAAAARAGPRAAQRGWRRAGTGARRWLGGREQGQLRHQRQPTPQERRDLLFAWRVCKFVKSNAIVFAREEATVGVGAGQMSRVYSSRIGAIKAEDAGPHRARRGNGLGCVLPVPRRR